MKKKKLSKTWTTVTTLSKTLALILFIALPFLGFYAGREYQKRISPQFIEEFIHKPALTPEISVSPTIMYK